MTIDNYRSLISLGWAEIHHVCKFGCVDQLELLLYYGCSIDAQISGSGNTALHGNLIF